MKKKIITKKRFLQINLSSAKSMAKNHALKKKSYELIKIADNYRWIHQASWMGEPILNIVQDVFDSFSGQQQAGRKKKSKRTTKKRTNKKKRSTRRRRYRRSRK